MHSRDDSATPASPTEQADVALRELRRYSEAANAHREAVAIFRQTGDRLREGIALRNLDADQTRASAENES